MLLNQDDLSLCAEALQTASAVYLRDSEKLKKAGLFARAQDLAQRAGEFQTLLDHVSCECTKFEEVPANDH